MGRVGKAAKITILGRGEFESVYAEKTGSRKGYIDRTDLLYETVNDTASAPVTDKGEVVDIACSYVRSLFNDLMAFAKKSVSTNYKAKAADVTEAQVAKAQSIVDDITRSLKVNADIKILNQKLLELYSVITREMRDVRNHLFAPIIDSSSLQRAQRLISNEQDTLDTMAGQVMLIKQQREANKLNEGKQAKKIDLLDQMGLKVAHVTDSKIISQIKDLMGSNANQLKKVYEVINSNTQTKYNNHIKTASNKKTALYWHGSRNENWFNILQTGLMIRPAGAVHTGSMFDDGVYGASSFQKSYGYTSGRNSYWAHGGSNVAYLALFEFHMGNELHVYKHDSSCYTISKKVKKEGYDSVYAHKGIDLRNDEFIVYDAAQVTVKYLIEIGN